MRQVKKQPLAVVIGMPGAGKTKVGKLAATMLNLPFRDADNIVEQETGKSIAQIIEIDGESIFRQIECEIVCRTLNEFDGGIFALGGGAPMTSDIHEALLQYRRDGGTVIYLDADCDEASSRAARGGKRPLLANDGKSKWMELYAKRHLVYEQLATITIRSHQTIPQKVARRMVDALREKVVHVSGFEPYDVRVGFDVYSNLRKLLGDKVLRVALIHSRPVQRHADHIRTLLRQAGYIVSEITIPDAEFGKTVNVAQGVWNRLAEDGFTRSDAIVGLGGGAATDLAGFIAATWMRGIRYVNCPTSLLAMVDASTGGKTGINLSHGKNLVGSFFSPVGVLADLRTLNTLPGEIFIEGLGEVAKCGFIDDPEILRILENHAYELNHFDANQSDEWLSEIPSELIVRSVDVKSNFVSVDLKEAGPREFLNYGHTLGHAIEQVEHFRWRHGQAVSVGMVFAAELAHNLGMISSHLVDYHRELLSSLGLQTTWSNGSWQEVLDLMHKDKKARGHQLRFVVLEDIGRPVAITDPPIGAVHDAFERIRG